MDKNEHGSTGAESTVLEVIAAEGRFTLQLVQERTGLDESTVHEVLHRLASDGTVRQVSDELYEHVPEDSDESNVLRGIPDLPNEETQTAPIDPSVVDSDEDAE